MHGPDGGPRGAPWAIRTWRSGSSATSAARSPGRPRQAGLERDLSSGEWLVNPGGVGQPRDGDPRAAWLLLDTETWKAHLAPGRIPDRRGCRGDRGGRACPRVLARAPLQRTVTTLKRISASSLSLAPAWRRPAAAPTTRAAADPGGTGAAAPGPARHRAEPSRQRQPGACKDILSARGPERRRRDQTSWTGSRTTWTRTCARRCSESFDNLLSWSRAVRRAPGRTSPPRRRRPTPRRRPRPRRRPSRPRPLLRRRRPSPPRRTSEPLRPTATATTAARSRRTERNENGNGGGAGPGAAKEKKEKGE